MKKVWYQVYTKTDEGKPWVFGFAINDGIVEHFPVYNINREKVEVARAWFRNRGIIEVVKICEQIIK